MIFEKHKFRAYDKVLFIFFIFPFVLFYPNPFDESQESVIIFGSDNLEIKLFDVRTETKQVSFKANNSYNLSLNCSFVKMLNEFILKMLNISNSEFFSFENESSNDGSCELAIERKYGSLVNTNAKYMIEYNYNNLFCNVSIAYSSIKDGCFFVYLCNHSFLNYCGENDDVVTIFLNYLKNVTFFLNDENNDSNETNLNSVNSSNLYVKENNSNDDLNYSSEIVTLENLSFENHTKNNTFENNNSDIVILSSSNLSNYITNQNSSNNLSENKTLESNLSLEDQLFEVQIDDVFYEDESISYTIINKGCKGVFEKKVYGIDGLGKQIVKIFSNSTISTRRTFKFTLPSGNYVLSIKCENFEINSSFEVLLKQNSCEDIFKRISFLKTQISFLKEFDCIFQLYCYFPSVFEGELNIRNKRSFKYSELNCSFFKISYEDYFYYYATNDFISEFITTSLNKKDKEKNRSIFYVLMKKGNEINTNLNIVNYLKINSKLAINFQLSPFSYDDPIMSDLMDVEIQPMLLGCEVSLISYDFSQEKFQKEKKQKGNNDKNFKNNELIYSFNLNEFKNKNNLTQRINLTQFQYVENSVTLYFNKNNSNSVLNFKKNFSLISDFIVVLFLDLYLNNFSLLNLATIHSESNSNSSNFKLLSEKTDESNIYNPFIDSNIPFLNDREESEDGLLIENLVENSILNLTISENFSSQNLSTLGNITNNSELKALQSRIGFSIFIKSVFQKINGFFVRFFKK